MHFSSSAMPSVTRSRRVEGPTRHAPESLPATHTRSRNKTTSALQQIDPPHQKRRRNDHDEYDRYSIRSPKKQKLSSITFQIPSSSNGPPRATIETTSSGPLPVPGSGPRASSPAGSKPHPPLSQQRHRDLHHPPVPLQSQAPTRLQSQQPQQREQVEQPPPPNDGAAFQNRNKPNKPGKKQNGLINSQPDVVQSQLQLQSRPNSLPKPSEGRKLRSQETVRFKSELSAYFPDYDEVIGNDVKPKHVIDADTTFLLVGPAQPKPTPRPEHLNVKYHDGWPIRSYSDDLFTNLVDCQKLDLTSLMRLDAVEGAGDPLPESLFDPAHKKAERAERSIRNSERGRAQHEKEQIIRLLDGLQGPDWLRTMGVSGVTESKKKTFVHARRHFIKGCEAILEKFRKWNEEEKRKKSEKAALAEAARLENGKRHGGDIKRDQTDSENEDGSRSREGSDAAGRDSPISDGDPPEYSDVDASIAKQLREETMARSKLAAKKAPKRGRKAPLSASASAPQPLPPLEASVPRPFTSFFSKKYQRDAAMSTSRRKGRTVLAWGQPVPDMAEAEFALPPDFRDESTLRCIARRKRRDRRGSRH